MGVTSRSVNLTNALNQEVSDIKFIAKSWWENLGTSKQDKIIQAVEYNKVLDISDYQEYGISVIKDYSNAYSYIPNDVPARPTMTNEKIVSMNNSIVEYCKKYNTSVNISYHGMYSNQTTSPTSELRYEFYSYIMSFGRSDAKKLIYNIWMVPSYTQPLSGLGYIGYNPKNGLNFISPGFVVDLDRPSAQPSRYFDVEGTRFDFANLIGICGDYNFSYDASISVPKSLPVTQVVNSNMDLAQLQSIYDAQQKQIEVSGTTVKSLEDIIKDTGSIVDSTNGTLEEVKKSNGFLGSIKDFVTVTLPDFLGKILDGVKGIPAAIGSIVGTVIGSIGDFITITLPDFLSNILSGIIALPNAFINSIQERMLDPPDLSFLDLFPLLLAIILALIKLFGVILLYIIGIKNIPSDPSLLPSLVQQGITFTKNINFPFFNMTLYSIVITALFILMLLRVTKVLRKAIHKEFA